jgi:hypothetical protein
MHPKFQASQLFRRTNTVDRSSTVSCGDPWYIANLDGEHEVGRKTGSSSIGHLHNRRNDLSETVWCFASSLSFLWWTMHAPCGSLLAAMSRSCKHCDNAPWHITNTQIDDDLGLPFFADHMRALTESFDSNLTDMNPRILVSCANHGLSDVTHG